MSGNIKESNYKKVLLLLLAGFFVFNICLLKALEAHHPYHHDGSHDCSICKIIVLGNAGNEALTPPSDVNDLILNIPAGNAEKLAAFCLFIIRPTLVSLAVKKSE